MADSVILGPVGSFILWIFSLISISAAAYYAKFSSPRKSIFLAIAAGAGVIVLVTWVLRAFLSVAY